MTNLWRAITVVSQGNGAEEEALDNLIHAADNLPATAKAQLVKHLLGSSGLNVTIGNNQLSASMVIQIKSVDKEALADLLDVVAKRIADEA